MGFILPTQPTTQPTMSTTDHAKQLISQKDTLEAELNTQLSILFANNCTMTSPLVDADGFPRSDIDIPTIRSQRARLAGMPIILF